MPRAQISCDLAPVHPVKGLEIFKATHGKTKTRIDIAWRDAERPKMMRLIPGDLQVLGLTRSPVSAIRLTVEGAFNIGRIMNRSIDALGKLAFGIPETDWEASAGVWEFKAGLPVLGRDLASVCEILYRLAERGRGKIQTPMAHKPFTLWDLRKALGIAQDAQRHDAYAVAVMDWIAVRSNMLSDAVKADKEAIRAAKRAERMKKERITRHNLNVQ